MATIRRTYTNQELSFLAAIHEDPSDDTSRLVYADWLEDNTQPEQAEFIRVQCKTAKSVDAWVDCGYTARERGLLRKFGARWRGHALMARGRVSKYGSLWFKRFHRGLPDAECYLSNHAFCVEQARQTLEVIPPHYQLLVLMNVYPGPYSDDATPLLNLPVFERAQRVHIRALGSSPLGLPTAGGPPEVTLADEVVDAAIEIFRSRKMLYVQFGPVSPEAKERIKAKLSPNVPTITPASV